MAIPKRKVKKVVVESPTVVLENGSLERWVGKVDERLRINEEFHKMLWDNLVLQHKETLSKIEEVGKCLTPMEAMVISHSKQIESNTSRLIGLVDVEHGAIPKLQQEMASIKTTAGYVAAVVGAIISAIMLFGKYLLQHLVGK